MATTTPIHCAECKAPLPPGATKCPSCGAPVWPEARALPDRRPTVAAVLLIILLLLAAYQGYVLVKDPLSPLAESAFFGGPSVSLSGVVTSQDGSPLGGVNITSVARNVSAVSHPNGTYRIDNVSAGYVVFQFSHPAHGSAEAAVFLYMAENVNVTLPPQGAPTRHVEAPMVHTIVVIAQACGMISIGLGVLCLAGAIACYRRRNWGLALGAAIGALFVSLPLSLVIGGIAVAVIGTSRSQFRK